MNDLEQQLNVLALAMVQLQLLAAASEQGDQQAQAIMQEIQKRAQEMVQQSQPQFAKCGGKMKKKEIGGKVPVGKCGCKAHLKRIGGQLVTVDCNGNIVK